MNCDEAQRAQTKAADYRARGELRRALKFYEISERLLPSPDVREIITLLKAEINSNSSGNSAHNSRTQASDGPVQQICNIFLDLEDKYIAPSMKSYIRIMICVIIVLVIYKFFLRQEMGIFRLPGDISYSTENVQISFPIVSCLLLSFFMNAFGQAFNRP
jgi:hypothetical protein